MANQLLLIKDVENLGRSGDMVNVKPGYARNFLLPQSYAVIADKHTMRMQARLQEERTKKAAVDKQESEAVANQLKDVVISTTVKVDHEGRMYGSVSAHDVVELLGEQAKIIVEKRDILLKHAIKALGEHQITIKLKEGVTAIIVLDVISEDPRFIISKEKTEAEEAPVEE